MAVNQEKNKERLTSGKELIRLIKIFETFGYEVTGILKESDISKRFNITIQRSKIDVDALMGHSSPLKERSNDQAGE